MFNITNNEWVPVYKICWFVFVRFRHSDDGFPVRDSIVNAIVRSYIDLEIPDRLVPLIKDKVRGSITLPIILW